MENYSLSDIRAVTDRDDQGGFGGGWFWIVVLFLFMFGFGRNGFGNGYENPATSADVQRGFDTNTIVNKLDGITSGICDSSYATAQLINGVNANMCQGFNSVNSGIADLGYRTQNCCCETNRIIDAVRYEAAKNTCDIATAIHAEGEATRALINANTVQDLRDRLEARDRDLLPANFQLSQQAQSANLIDVLRPVSKPAYITCSPYQSINYGCGWGQGYNVCGCCA